MENGSYYYEKARKRWRILYTDNNGNRKSIYGKTIEEVQAKHDKIKVALRNNTYIEKSRDTINNIMNELLDEQERKHKLKENSMLRKRITAGIISNMSFSNKPIQNVTPREINKELDKLVDPKGKYDYSNSYINKIYSLLRSIYDRAVKYRIILSDNNLLRNGQVEKPESSKKDKEIKPFNESEFKTFLLQLQKENDEYKPIFYVLILTGMRIGECLALKVKNIDLEENRIYIETSLTKNSKDKTVVGNDTKTKNSIRDIKLTETLRDLLEPLIQDKQKDDLVFSHDGKVIAVSTINSHFKKICAHANIRVDYYDKRKPNGKMTKVKTSTVNTHAIRHLTASIAIKEGANKKGVQHLLGHKKSSTTDIYANGTDELKESTIDIIDEYVISLNITNKENKELLQNIQNLNINDIDKQEVVKIKYQLLMNLNIRKLEEQTKDIILSLSNVGQAVLDNNKNLDEDKSIRLNIIYSLLNTFELLKVQTKNMRRNSTYNNNYSYNLTYIQTAQKLLKLIDTATNYKPVEQLSTIKAIAVNY